MIYSINSIYAMTEKPQIIYFLMILLSVVLMLLKNLNDNSFLNRLGCIYTGVSTCILNVMLLYIVSLICRVLVGYLTPCTLLKIFVSQVAGYMGSCNLLYPCIIFLSPFKDVIHVVQSF